MIKEIHFSLCSTCDIFAPQSKTVRKHLLTLFCCLFSSLFTLGQTGVDSSKPLVDTVNLPVKDSLAKPATILLQFKDVLRNHPYYNFFGKPVDLTIQERNVQGSEKLFYGILLLFFYYAMIRVLFQKYLSNVFALFFRATLRQQQIREQLLQTPLPSLLLNILFVTTGGIYAALLSNFYGYLTNIDFWPLALYCIGFLFVLYSGKFLVLKTLGWILRISKATDTYLFIVFMVNKMVGIFLLPILLFMAFPYPNLLQVIVTVSLFVLAVLLGYRLLLSYRAVRSEIRVNPFHFFLYLCAFEIAPLLLIYKVLLSFIAKTI